MTTLKLNDEQIDVLHRHELRKAQDRLRREQTAEAVADLIKSKFPNAVVVVAFTSADDCDVCRKRAAACLCACE